MTDYQTELIAYLEGEPTVSPLLGTRIYPDRLPQNVTLPAITYHQVSNPRSHTHGRASALVHPRLQLSYWATKKVEVVALRDAIRLALNGKTLDLGTITASILLLNEIEMPFEPDAEIHHHVQDYEFWFQEAVA